MTTKKTGPKEIVFILNMKGFRHLADTRSGDAGITDYCNLFAKWMLAPNKGAVETFLNDFRLTEHLDRDPVASDCDPDNLTGPDEEDTKGGALDVILDGNGKVLVSGSNPPFDDWKRGVLTIAELTYGAAIKWRITSMTTGDKVPVSWTGEKYVVHTSPVGPGGSGPLFWHPSVKIKPQVFNSLGQYESVWLAMAACVKHKATGSV